MKKSRTETFKIGQKVLVLNDDTEYEKRENVDFQKNRLFKITQFYEERVYLKII